MLKTTETRSAPEYDYDLALGRSSGSMGIAASLGSSKLFAKCCNLGLILEDSVFVFDW